MGRQCPLTELGTCLIKPAGCDAINCVQHQAGKVQGEGRGRLANGKSNLCGGEEAQANVADDVWDVGQDLRIPRSITAGQLHSRLACVWPMQATHLDLCTAPGAGHRPLACVWL